MRKIVIISLLILETFIYSQDGYKFIDYNRSFLLIFPSEYKINYDTNVLGIEFTHDGNIINLIIMEHEYEITFEKEISDNIDFIMNNDEELLIESIPFPLNDMNSGWKFIRRYKFIKNEYDNHISYYIQSYNNKYLTIILLSHDNEKYLTENLLEKFLKTIIIFKGI